MKVNQIIGIIIVNLILNNLTAQDLVYSQFYAAPLVTNPALTGDFDGNIRVSANYRGQWDNIDDNSFLYSTPSLSFEASIPERNIAFGVVVINDQTNNKIFNTFEGGLSFAYTLGLEKFKLSMGLQGWYKHTYFDQSRIRQSILISEPNLAETFSGFDANAGFFATHSLANEKSSIFYGGAVHHLFAPVDQVSQSDQVQFTRPMRYTLQGGVSLNIKDLYQLIPSFLATYQNNFIQLNLGTNLGFHFMYDARDRPEGTIFGGVWLRSNELRMESIIPTLGIQYQRFKLAVSYDMTVSPLAAGSSARPNTYEISFSYILKNEFSRDYQCYSIRY
ncbi:MAG: type IX secretion system membrane protein PorP/SprF [Chitinophagales bacterium]|jgi:type IX secretion system PorP/SprF family membrane protein|nr:type IX secretion system membrane protein PorP/SprF [Chitinophagales bacterium]